MYVCLEMTEISLTVPKCPELGPDILFFFVEQGL